MLVTTYLVSGRHVSGDNPPCFRTDVFVFGRHPGNTVFLLFVDPQGGGGELGETPPWGGSWLGLEKSWGDLGVSGGDLSGLWGEMLEHVFAT